MGAHRGGDSQEASLFASLHMVLRLHALRRQSFGGKGAERPLRRWGICLSINASFWSPVTIAPTDAAQINTVEDHAQCRCIDLKAG
jgi:hypothetical protein